MEFEIKDGLMVKIDESCNTASITKSPKATGNIFIPHYFEKDDKKYKIISIGSRAFYKCKIDSLTFPEDSEIKSFDYECFCFAEIKKLQIPPKVKDINSALRCVTLNEIEISQNNHHFILFNNQFVLSRSDNYIDKFDVLHFGIPNVEEVVIPAQVISIQEYSFNSMNRNKKLKSIKFEENSELKSIESWAFNYAEIEDLSIPASVECIGESSFKGNSKLKSVRFPINSKLKRICDEAFCKCNLESIFIPASVEYLEAFFQYNINLLKIEVSPENKFFKLIDDSYIVMESEHGSGVFDAIFFCRRDIESIIIPSYIKVIKKFAFQSCKQLKNITFESNSKLELIEKFAFQGILSEKLVFPPSLKKIYLGSLCESRNLKCVEFLSKLILIEGLCFSNCNKISTIIFSNADQIFFSGPIMDHTPDNTKILVRKNAQLSFLSRDSCRSKIFFIEDIEKEEEEKKISDEDKIRQLESDNLQLANKNRQLESDNLQLANKIQQLESNEAQLQSQLKDFERKLNEQQKAFEKQKKEHEDQMNQMKSMVELMMKQYAEFTKCNEKVAAKKNDENE